jgi:hypothetical protein
MNLDQLRTINRALLTVLVMLYAGIAVWLVSLWC